DIQFANSSTEIESSLNEFKPDVFVVYDDGFNYLTKMCLTNMREAALEMIEFAKKKKCTVIVSSSDAADHYEKYLERGADFVIRGEAEITLLELVNALKDKVQTNAIAGIVFNKQGENKTQELVVNSLRKVLKDLDSLPLPAWDILNIEPYRKMWMEKHGYFSINMVSTRGCPYKCNWCAKPIYGNRYNSHSPANIIAQIEQLNKLNPFDHIWFADDIFGLKPGWLKEFADLAEKKKLKFRYKIQSRADLLDEETIKDLARSGCETVWMGAESGSQKILDAMDKGTSIKQIYESTRLLKKYKIRSAFFLQFGYPGETIEDIHLTIKMVNELLPDDIGVSVSYPLPGTPFYEKVKNELKSKANWTDSDDLALMFQNNFPPEFYKQLHRYIHKSYRKHQSMDLLKGFFGNTNNKERFRRMLALPYYAFGSVLEKHKLKKILPHAAGSL
ncbi:MAG: B12-binding domain-containing radical SAM protein, partial [Bacteroidia bacterium]|nr:B12-binding domain-containing radical SAM protein [Bacteroidia bacterium]